MAEFPCAAMRRRLFDPPKSIHLFIENHREFIEFYRYFHILFFGNYKLNYVEKFYIV